MFKFKQGDFCDYLRDRAGFISSDNDALLAFAKEAAFADDYCGKEMTLIDEEGTIYAKAMIESPDSTEKRKFIIFQKSFGAMLCITWGLKGAFQVEIK